METLLKLGAKVDDTTTDNLTPVHVASHCNFPDAVEVLLAYKADVNSRALNNFCPINIATQVMNDDIKDSNYLSCFVLFLFCRGHATLYVLCRSVCQSAGPSVEL